MSAEVLREAAAVARDEWQDETTGPFKHAAERHLAVADWLEATARELDSLGDPDLSQHPQDGRRTAALKVAHAYLATPDRSRPGLGTAGVTGAQPDEPASQAGRPVAGGGS